MLKKIVHLIHHNHVFVENLQTSTTLNESSEPSEHKNKQSFLKTKNTCSYVSI